MTDSDRELARRIRALGREDRAVAPPFRRLWARAREQRSQAPRRSAAWALAGAALVLLAALTTATWREAPPAPTASAIVEWRSPTDFLLETPGRELLGSAPPVLTGPHGLGDLSPLPSPSPPAKGEI